MVCSRRSKAADSGTQAAERAVWSLRTQPETAAYLQAHRTGAAVLTVRVLTKHRSRPTAKLGGRNPRTAAGLAVRFEHKPARIVIDFGSAVTAIDQQHRARLFKLSTSEVSLAESEELLSRGKFTDLQFDELITWSGWRAPPRCESLFKTPSSVCAG